MSTFTNFDNLLTQTESDYEIRTKYIFHCLSQKKYSETAESLVLLTNILSKRNLYKTISMLRANINIFLDNKEYYNILLRRSESVDSSLNKYKEWKQNPVQDTISSTGFDFSIHNNRRLIEKKPYYPLKQTTIDRMKESLAPFNSYTVEILSDKTQIGEWFFNKLNNNETNKTIKLDILLKFADSVGVSPDYLLGNTDERDVYIVERTKQPLMKENKNIKLLAKAKKNINCEFGKLDITKQNELIKKNIPPSEKIDKIDIRNESVEFLPMKFIYSLSQETNCSIAYLLGYEDKPEINDYKHIPSDYEINYACVTFKKNSKNVLNLYNFFCKEIFNPPSTVLSELCDSLFILFVYFDSNTIYDILSNFNDLICMISNQTKCFPS